MVAGNAVEIVEKFTYLGSHLDNTGGSDAEVIRRIALTRYCMKALDRNIWRSSITTATKIRLYCAYILPVLLYGAETWTLTKVLSKKVDSFDLWCQRRILRVHYSHHISNCEIRNRTGCTPATDIIRCRRLQLFGHIARSAPEMNHCRALRVAIRGPPADWKRPRGRPRQTWTRTVENDLKPANIGLQTAWRRAQDRADYGGTS